MARNLVAILRGLTPDNAVEVADILIHAGFYRIEVPLNSPSPFDSIEQLAKRYGDEALIGAGTVLSEDDARRVSEAGGKLVVSPNANPDVIRKTKELGMISLPGVFTPTECFAALGAGADGLKFFPASVLGVSGFKAMKAVLPANTRCYAVGGIAPESMLEWLKAGITGFGIGSDLFKPDYSHADIKKRAEAIITTYDEATK